MNQYIKLDILVEECEEDILEEIYEGLTRVGFNVSYSAQGTEGPESSNTTASMTIYPLPQRKVLYGKIEKGS